MATGASTADLAIILIDARYGVQTQTRRHSFIASLLGIHNIVVAVNKMGTWLNFLKLASMKFRQSTTSLLNSWVNVSLKILFSRQFLH